MQRGFLAAAGGGGNRLGNKKNVTFVKQEEARVMFNPCDVQ